MSHGHGILESVGSVIGAEDAIKGMVPIAFVVPRAGADEALAAQHGVAEAERLQMEIEPMTGAEMQKMLETAYGRPRRIVERATELILPPNIKPN